MLAFLDFPREIRDRIYELNLVYGTIPISTSKNFIPTSYGQLCHVEWNCCCEDCTADANFRRTTKRSIRDSHKDVRIKDSDGTLISKAKQKSYGQPEVSNSGCAVGFRQKLVIFDSGNLSVFLGNRQIYQEASEIFYSRNKFGFGCQIGGYYSDSRHRRVDGSYSDSLANVSDFIQDRPEHALAHLRSIRFTLGRDPKDKVFEEYWYKGEEGKSARLCKTLAKKCGLSESDVGIFGINQHSAPHPCLEQLTKITNLQHLHIWLGGRCEMPKEAVESALATIKIFRSQSLLGGDKMGNDDIEISERSGEMLVRVSTWKADKDEQF